MLMGTTSQLQQEQKYLHYFRVIIPLNTTET